LIYYCGCWLHILLLFFDNTIPTSYKLHGHTLKTVESAKYLGCTFTSDLQWKNHVNNICNKAIRTIGLLWTLSIQSISVWR
jgi:hypothetical protein